MTQKTVGLVNQVDIRKADFMTLSEALKWFENRVPALCGDCCKNFDFTCSGADSQKCAAYRIAVAAITAHIESMKG